MNNVLISPRTDPKKRGAVSQIRSKQVSTPRSARRVLSVSPSKCVLCEKKAFKPKDYNQFASMITKSLYVKYASSQNYYYTKDINEMLADSHTPAVIKFKDLQCYDEEDEYLKRFYKNSEYTNKIQLLTEYYKFHWDIPRLFMMPTTEVLNRFHDKKRRLQYIRVTKMLKDQKESKSPHGKPEEAAAKGKQEEPKLAPITDRVLVDLETSYSILKTEDIKGYTSSKKSKVQPAEEKKKGSSRKALDDEERKKDSRRSNTREYSGVNTNNKGRDDNNTQKKIQKRKDAGEQAQAKGKDASISNTLHDLNLKLGEIISNSETTHLFDRTEQSINQSMSHLKSFLNYMQTKPNNIADTTGIIAESPPAKEVKEVKEVPRKTAGSHDQIPSRPSSARKSLSRKPSTPRLEKMEKLEKSEKPEKSGKSEEPSQQDGPKRSSIITWNRTDSVPLVRPSPNLTRRESKTTNEPSKVEEKPTKELEPAVLGSARVMSAQSSLSSTSTSKSKSVYPSVTRIRNFEEAVKIGQQSSFQPKLMTPTETAPASTKNVTKSHPTSSANITRGTSGEKTSRKESGEAAPAGTRNVDLSIKIPQILLEERLKDFNLQISPSGSQIYSPKTATAKSSTTKLVKSTMPLTSRGPDGFLKNLDNISPLHSPQFRIKSHRESGSSFEKGNNKESSQPASTTNKQVPLIQMTLSKNGHARFASGGMISQSGRTTNANSRNSGSPTFPVQTGREAKGLMPFGTLDMKDVRMMPSSASRREMMLGKGVDLKVEAAGYKAGEVGIMTDREKELTPLTPKMSAATHRDKLISHKHTRSEGGKLKSDQLEALMGTINDQKIRELLRLNDGGATGLSDLINKSRKNNAETAAMKNMGSYNMSNIVLASHRDNRDSNYDSAPVSSSVHQRKQSQPKMSGEGIVTPRNVKMEVGGSGSKSKSQLKRTDSVGSETKGRSSTGVDNKDEYKPGKTKTKFFG